MSCLSFDFSFSKQGSSSTTISKSRTTDIINSKNNSEKCENKLLLASDEKKNITTKSVSIKLTDIMKSKNVSTINLVPDNNNESKNQTVLSDNIEKEPSNVNGKRLARKRKSVSFQLRKPNDSEIPKQRIKLNGQPTTDRVTRHSVTKMITNLPTEMQVTKKLNDSPSTNSPQFKKRDENTTNSDTAKCKNSVPSRMMTRNKNTIPQLDGDNDIITKSTRKTRSSVQKSNSKSVQEKMDESSESNDSAFEQRTLKRKSQTSVENKNGKLKIAQVPKKTTPLSDDSDFEPYLSDKNTKPVIRSKKKSKTKHKPADNGEVLSNTKNKRQNQKSSGIDIWIEIFCESQWMPVDVVKKGNISKIDDIRVCVLYML